RRVEGSTIRDGKMKRRSADFEDFSRSVDNRRTKSLFLGGAPVIRTLFGRVERVHAFESRRQRRGASRQHLMMINVEQSYPTLLTHGQRNEARELDQLFLGEVRTQSFPETVVGVQSPRDRLGVRERSALSFRVAIRRLKVEELVKFSLRDTGELSGFAALIAAILALH